MNMRDNALTEAKMALVAAREAGKPDALVDALRSHPTYADALTEFDLGLMATSSYGSDADAPDVMAIAQTARARAFAAVLGVQAGIAAAAQPAAAVSLKALRNARGRSLAALAARLGLGIDVLSALEMGRIRVKSVPQRLCEALSEALDATVEQVTAALAYDVAPAFRRGQPGARGATNKQLDFAEAVISSQSMTPEQRAIWLAESAD